MMKAYGLQLPFLAAIVVLLIINLGRVVAERAGERGVLSVFLRAGIERFSGRKDHGDEFFVFRIPGADDSVYFPGICGLGAQWAVAEIHAREGEGIAQPGARGCAGVSLPSSLARVRYCKFVASAAEVA